MEFEINVTAHIEIVYHYNNDTRNIKSYLLSYIDSCQLAGFKIENINRMTIKTVNDRCNKKYEYDMHRSMKPLETNLNIIFAKNPLILSDQNIKHLFIRKYSHIPFNV